VSGNTRKWPVHEPAQVTQPIAQDVHSLLVAGQIIDSEEEKRKKRGRTSLLEPVGRLV
jgi:hypothetical protein